MHLTFKQMSALAPFSESWLGWSGMPRVVDGSLAPKFLQLRG
jgi:hypothetical protein